MQIQIIVIIILLAGALWYAFLENHRAKSNLAKWKQNADRKMYELAILKELAERTGYSLDVQNIIDIITGSLHQFIEYSAVSYFLLGQEKIIFKVHLEESVSRKFVDEVRDRMLKSLSALSDKEYTKEQLSETLSGAILTDEEEEPVRSFFNIPLVIGGKIAGILTIAHTKPGLYEEEDMTILYKITQQASNAVSKLEEVVKTEQRKLNAMVESMSEGIVMTDKNYALMVVNPAALKIIGLKDKKEITIFDFIDNLDGKFDIRGKLEESIKLDKILVSDEVLIKDRFYQIIVSPVKSSSGLVDSKPQILGGVTIFHDITHEKEVEKLREDFMAIVVHELRTPLTGIRNLAQVMTKYSVKENEQKDLKKKINLILGSSSHMLELVNDLLDIAKIESGKFEIHTKLTDIRQLIKKNTEMFNATADKVKIVLDSKIDDNIPEKIILDPDKISQAISNLISNAIKFTKEGGKVTIQALFHNKAKDIITEASGVGIKWFISDKESDVFKKEDLIVIAVTDSGIGISQQDRTQLFNKFKQLEEAALSENKGTGLGLSIVKGIINAHGGKVGVSSDVGVGSTFFLTLPVKTK